MPGVNKLRGFGLVLGALALFALPIAAGRAQTAVSSGDIIEKLAVEAESDIDLAALRQQAADRIKARADAQPQKRPPIAPQLTKLPQMRFDVVFDQDASLIRPASYQTIGSIADALSDPKTRPYRYLIVDHVESAGRRDHNLILSQRRAESIRDVLVNTFKVSPKRLQALGLGEEQLQDVNRPAAPANARVQIITVASLKRPNRQRRLRRHQKAQLRQRKRSADHPVKGVSATPAAGWGRSSRCSINPRREWPASCWD